MKLKVILISLKVCAVFAVGAHYFRMEAQIDQFESEYIVYEQAQKRNPAEAVITSPMLLQIQDFVKASGPNHEQENSARLRENPCFEKLVARFYAKVRLQDIKTSLKENLATAKAVQTDALTETSEPVAGWLWKLAVETTQGDHNLAQQIIGVCSLPQNNQTWNEEAGLLANERSELLYEVHSLAARIAGSPKEAEEIHFIIKSYLEKPACPNASSKMYWPRSLGAEFDVEKSALLKEKSRDAHYENVIHSAYTSCLLYQKGMPSPVIEEIQERLRSLQRADRMCHLLQSAMVQAEHLKFDDFDWTSGPAQSILKTLSENPGICSSEATFTDELKPLADRICPVMRSHQHSVKGPAELLSVMHQSFIDLDTALFVQLHPQWRMSPACDKVESRNRLPGLLASATSLRCPAGWSPARCARVIRNLENWVRDDLYQAEQVRMGLRFSRLHCVSLGTETSVLKNACTLAGEPPPSK